MMDPHTQAAFMKARSAQEAAAIANGDISGLIDLIHGLQQQVADLTDAFHAHKHAYTDIDNTGTVQNKTTAIPQ